jgi:hypothetical protein
MRFNCFKILLLLFFIIQISNEVFAQDRSFVNKKDSIKTSGGHLVAYKDTVSVNGDSVIHRKEVWVKEREGLYLDLDTVSTSDIKILFAHFKKIIHSDTIIIIEDSVISRNARVLLKVKEYTQRNTIWAKLLKAVLVFDYPKPSNQDLTMKELQQTEERYAPYEEKIIRNVNIKILDVFGPTIQNPDGKPKSLLEKSGDFFHVRTHRWIIKNRLLFRKGDPINSLKVSESERLLRDNNFIYDARIFVRDTLNNDSVDVDVIVQDVWSIAAAVDGDPRKEQLTLGLNESNFMGLGQQVQQQIRFDPTLPKGYNYTGLYTVNNIYKTFLTSQVYYRFQTGQTYYGGGINRDFISPAIKWAGGSNLNWSDLPYYLYNSKDSLVSTQRIKNVQADAWLGYGIDISSRDSYYRGSRFILSGRVVRTKYFDAPVLPDTMINTYYDNYMYFGTVGVFARKFYRDSYIFRLGRTEDIPEGYLLSFTGGYQQRNQGNRPYFGIDAAHSRYHYFGYLHTGFSLGSFVNNGLENGVVSTRLLYFTPLLKFYKWRCRQFVGFRFIAGLEPIKGNYLYINQEQGVRGFNSSLVKGTRKVVFNYELNVFPPLNLIGFKAALILFTDLAWISTSKKVFDKKNFYPGYGIGLRFRNDHLIFSTIQINLAYYPSNSSIGKQDLMFYERSSFYYSYYNFQFNRPSVLPFN